MNSTAHTGAAGEMIVSAYFLQQGLEVFRNVAASGPADLFVWNKTNGKSAAVDVKTISDVYVRKDGTINYEMVKYRDDNVWQVGYVRSEASVRLPEGFWAALGMDMP